MTVFITFVACQEDFSGGLLWDKSRINTLAAQPCSKLHSSFRSGVNIKRWCQSDGSWSSVGISDCTMFINSNPIVLLYFTVSSETGDAQQLITDIYIAATQAVNKVSD